MEIVNQAIVEYNKRYPADTQLNTANAENSEKPDDNAAVAAQKAAEADKVAEMRQEKERLKVEARQIADLAQRDREVKAHEEAHLSRAGRHAQGGATFDYERGPNGRLYAVAGEVKLDTSPVEGDPEATQEKARIIQEAALAPVKPSTQDRRVAADAAALEQTAQADIKANLRAEVEAERMALEQQEERAAANRVQENATQEQLRLERQQAAAYEDVTTDNNSGAIIDVTA